MKRIILSAFTFMVLLISTTVAQDTYGNASVEIYKYQSNPILHTQNGIFKDINVTFSLLKSNDSSINIHNIESDDTRFKPFQAYETLQENNTTYWLKVNLGKNFPSGRFIYSYADAGFTEHTILPSQKLEKMKTKGIHRIYFNYTNRTDAQIYYFKLVPEYYRIPLIYISVSTQESFFANLNQYTHVQLIMGLLLGIILMAGIYNMSLYYYHKEKSFLYYALMQFGMVLALHYASDTYFWAQESLLCRNRTYESLINLSTSFFAILFVQHFFETKKYFPKLYIIMRGLGFLIIIDMILALFYKSIIIEYKLLPIFMIPLLYTGYKRAKEGYVPAKFYLLGWLVLMLSVFIGLNEWTIAYFSIEPIYLGATAEAILFSMALSYKMFMSEQEKALQKELLIQQSKLSSMGEMLANIAHQWRQPLTHLSYIFINIKAAQKHNELNVVYLDKKIDDANTQLNYMSQTIDDFKDFYTPKKEKELFLASEMIKEAVSIIKSSLISNHIIIEIIYLEDTHLYTYKNELKQVLHNIILNAQDILLKREIKFPKIILTMGNNTISIQDNAGGIPNAILSKIFEPYFSTKNGMGIGLYMSKIIVEHNIGGVLSVKNSNKGACFTIEIPIGKS